MKRARAVNAVCEGGARVDGVIIKAQIELMSGSVPIEPSCALLSKVKDLIIIGSGCCATVKRL